MIDLPPDWPPSFEDEAYRLIGKIVAAWSDIDEHIYSEIEGIRTLIYVLQARAWRNANQGQAHFGHVKPVRAIPHSKFNLRVRYFRSLLMSLNYHDKALAKEFEDINREISRLYEVRNKLAHYRVSVISSWTAPSVSLRANSLFYEWQRKTDKLHVKRLTPPIHEILMTKQQLTNTLAEMNNVLSKLYGLRKRFDDTITPPEQPAPPS